MVSLPKPLPTCLWLSQDILGMAKLLDSGAVELAVNGRAFSVLHEQGFFDHTLFYFRIFARVTPEEKVAVVKMFRDRGLIVGMCGDGGNDCGRFCDSWFVTLCIAGKLLR